MKVITNSLKKNTFDMFEIFSYLIHAGLFICILYAGSNKIFEGYSRSTIYAEISTGEYENVGKLLKADYTLNNIKVDKKTGHPDYTSEQLFEMFKLAAEVGTSTPLILAIKDIKTKNR